MLELRTHWQVCSFPKVRSNTLRMIKLCSQFGILNYNCELWSYLKLWGLDRFTSKLDENQKKTRPRTKSQCFAGTRYCQLLSWKLRNKLFGNYVNHRKTIITLVISHSRPISHFAKWTFHSRLESFLRRNIVSTDPSSYFNIFKMAFPSIVLELSKSPQRLGIVRNTASPPMVKIFFVEDIPHLAHMSYPQAACRPPTST